MYNKVVLNGIDIVDLTGDTVNSDTLLSGYIAHDKSGKIINGSIQVLNEESLQNDGEYLTIPKGYFPSEIKIKINTEPPEPPIPDNSLYKAEIGTIVKVPLLGDSTYRTFIVVHQGVPSELYDSSCDGTWLLEEDVNYTRVYDNRNDYSDSLIASWLGSTYIGDFSESIKTKINTVKIPYIANSILYSGENGFSCKAFLPSINELGSEAGSKTGLEEDGACLSYFVGSADEDPIRGASERYWTRSPYTVTNDSVWTVSSTGKITYRDGSYTYGVRTMLVMSKDTILLSENIVQ